MADLQAMYDHAYDLLCDGNTDEAIAAYQAIIDLDPNYTEAVHDLAHAYADGGNLDEAIVTARRLTELTPDDPGGWGSHPARLPAARGSRDETARVLDPD